MPTKLRRIIPVLSIICLLITRNGYAQEPILVLGTEKNFGYFTGEMLKTEGFNLFRYDSMGNKKITSAYLKRFNIILLAEDFITNRQKKLFEKYVKQGGSLIAFKPDQKLNKLFGVKDADGAVPDTYIAIDTTMSIGKGLLSQPLQTHVETAKYQLAGARKIASVYSNRLTATEYPAVVENTYGKGHAIAFLYNLPQSIVYTRQGNFKDAGKEMDGITGIRAMDLFTNGWVDSSNNTLNQADEQMRLLTHCIERVSLSIKPLPRFWYFPDTLNCLVTLNNDGEDSKEEEFYQQFEDVNAKGAKMTLYVKEVDLISKGWISKWINKGFEMSGHPDDTRQATNPDWKTMDSVYKTLQRKLKSGYGVNEMRTITNHWFVWCGNNADGTPDFAAQARIEENNGIGLDCNYAHYDNNSSQGHFLGAMGINQGNYTGSGLSMKFADVRGDIINVYQQLNNVYDQQYMEHKDPDGYYNAFKGLMDRSLENEVYSFICVRAHNNEYFFSKVPLMNMLDYANSKSIPVWTELKLLEFLQAKDEAGFDDINWVDSRLTFTIKSSLKHSNGISFLIPASYQRKRINAIVVNGQSKAFSIKTIKGSEYAMATIQPGSNYAIAVDYVE